MIGKDSQPGVLVSPDKSHSGKQLFDRITSLSTWIQWNPSCLDGVNSPISRSSYSVVKMKPICVGDNFQTCTTGLISFHRRTPSSNPVVRNVHREVSLGVFRLQPGVYRDLRSVYMMTKNESIQSVLYLYHNHGKWRVSRRIASRTNEDRLLMTARGNAMRIEYERTLPWLVEGREDTGDGIKMQFQISCRSELTSCYIETNDPVCVNGGVCLSLANGQPYCRCPVGIRGPRCEQTVPECREEPSGVAFAGSDPRRQGSIATVCRPRYTSVNKVQFAVCDGSTWSSDYVRLSRRSKKVLRRSIEFETMQSDFEKERDLFTRIASVVAVTIGQFVIIFTIALWIFLCISLCLTAKPDTKSDQAATVKRPACGDV